VSKVYEAIPEPGDALDTLRLAVVALKQNVEILTGNRGPNGWANQVFVQQEAPVAAKEGDIWLKYPVVAADTWALSVWKNGKWLLTTL